MCIWLDDSNGFTASSGFMPNPVDVLAKSYLCWLAFLLHNQNLIPVCVYLMFSIHSCKWLKIYTYNCMKLVNLSAENKHCRSEIKRVYNDRCDRSSVGYFKIVDLPICLWCSLYVTLTSIVTFHPTTVFMCGYKHSPYEFEIPCSNAHMISTVNGFTVVYHNLITLVLNLLSIWINYQFHAIFVVHSNIIIRVQFG